MAEEFLSPIDMLLDENNTDNIKLYNEDNQEVEFEQIARSAGQTSDITEGQRSLAESLPDEVYSALLSIPAHKLSPFLLYVQGYSLKEIAQMEYENGNTPEDMLETVKSRIFWTRSRLKTLLKEYAGSRKLQ